MKKLLLLVSVAATAFSCAEVEQVTPTLNNESKEITIGVAMPDEAIATRISLTEDITTGAWVTAWEAGDAIAVSSQSKYNVSKFDIVDGFTSKNASFTGTLQDETKPIRMIYPYDAYKMNSNLFVVDLSNQSIEINSLATLGKYSYMINETVIEDPTQGLDDQKMVHITTALELNLRFSNIEDGASAVISHVVVGTDNGSSIEIPAYAFVNMTKDASSAELYSSQTNGTITLVPNECAVANYDETASTEYALRFNALPFEIAQNQTLAIAVYVEYIVEDAPSTMKKIVLEATNTSSEAISFEAGSHSFINKNVDMNSAETSSDGEYLATIFSEDFESGSKVHFTAKDDDEIIVEDGNSILKFNNAAGENMYATQIRFNLDTDQPNLTAGATYELSFDVKADTAFDTSVPSGQLHASYGDFVGSLDCGGFDVTTEWTTVVLRFTVGESVTQARRLVFNTGLCPETAVYLDNLSLREVNTYYVDQSVAPYYWKGITSDGDFTDYDSSTNLISAIYWSSGEAVEDTDGNMVYKITSWISQNEKPSIWDGQLIFEFPKRVVGEKCKLSFRVKSEGSCTIPSLAAQYLDGTSEQYSSEVAGEVPTSTEWQSYSYEFTTAHDNVYRVKAGIGLIQEVFYFDDVKVSIWTNEI